MSGAADAARDIASDHEVWRAQRLTSTSTTHVDHGIKWSSEWVTMFYQFLSNSVTTEHMMQRWHWRQARKAATSCSPIATRQPFHSTTSEHRQAQSNGIQPTHSWNSIPKMGQQCRTVTIEHCSFTTDKTYCCPQVPAAWRDDVIQWQRSRDRS